MSACRVDRSELSGNIRCPPNKSYTHRAIFAASLSPDPSTIQNILHAKDTESTIEACKVFGAQIKRDGDTLTVISPITFGGNRVIDAGNSGTTIRIAAGIAALSPAITTLTGDQSLQHRPMRPILDALESIGAECKSEDGMPPVVIRGRVGGGAVTIRGGISSQFVSSLLFCAPLTEGITINIQGELVSKPYLDATIATLQRFGVHVETIQKYKQYRVAPQIYRGAEFTIPPDYSSLAILLSASVLVGKNMSITAPKSDLPQADAVFLDILEKLGADVKQTGDAITAGCAGELVGGTFDLANTPDLLPPLSILALRCKRPLNITNVRHARYKETDRISAMCTALAGAGLKVDEREDGMSMARGAGLHGAKLDSRGDHRLFMALCAAAMYVGDCTVSDPESVQVSYPEFIPEMRRLGASITQ